MMMNGSEAIEEGEAEDELEVLDRAVGGAARSAYDAAYVTALKTVRSLIRSTNTEVTLSALEDMISVFDPANRAPDDLAEPVPAVRPSLGKPDGTYEEP